MVATGVSSFRVALMLKAKGAWGRNVVAGVSDYVQSTRVVWDFLLFEDFRGSITGIDAWSGDGIIADFDDPEFERLFSRSKLPIVAVGGSYERASDYPVGIPYVATDNFALVEAAYDHLVEMGLTHFAFYSQPPAPTNRWAQQREAAFCKICQSDGIAPLLFEGHFNDGLDWDSILRELIDWLAGLPKPIGVIAVTDARARQVLQACIMANIAVPEEVALVGIDDDHLLRMLSRIPISSVRQGTREMGRIAAEMMHRRLIGDRVEQGRILVPPKGLNALASSRHQPTYDPYIMRARHYIRQFAAQGVKVAQVAAYVGVSRATLDTHFRKAFGWTVHDEMLTFRLERAKQMLSDRTLSFAEIAARSGFTSLPYMYAVFRRELGCTPTEFQATLPTAVMTEAT